MAEEEKLCVFCDHFNFDPATPDYSEMTPGWNAEIDCFKNHWELDIMKDNTDTFRERILSASSCKDYLFFKDA